MPFLLIFGSNLCVRKDDAAIDIHNVFHSIRAPRSNEATHGSSEIAVHVRSWRETACESSSFERGRRSADARRRSIPPKSIAIRVSTQLTGVLAGTKHHCNRLDLGLEVIQGANRPQLPPSKPGKDFSPAEPP